MAAPNLIGATTIYGKVVGVNLSNTSSFTIVDNAASSGKCLKINTLNVSNYTGTASIVTVKLYDNAALGGNSFNIVGSVSVPANSTLMVIDKSTVYYIPENMSVGASSTTGNSVHITCSYEEIA